MSKSTKIVTLEDALTILMNGFLRGGTGFLKGTGEIIKGTTGSHREVRVGVTYVSIFTKVHILKLYIFVYYFMYLYLELRGICPFVGSNLVGKKFKYCYASYFRSSC